MLPGVWRVSWRGAWALSALVVERCGDRRRAVVRASAWLELVGGVGHVDPAGEAVLCLVPPRPPLRLVALMAGVAVVLAVPLVGLGLLWWPALLVVVSAAGLAGVAGAVSLGRSRTARRRLRRARPGGAWCLRNFASARPGAGRALLERVCVEADHEGRVLWLDTAAPRLVEYYARSGFEVAAAEVVHRRGEPLRLYRMVRRPR